MAPALVLLFFGSILAFWISTICGGGASLILIPILNSLLAPSIVPFALTVGTASNSASRIIIFKKNINWKIFYWFVPFSIPAVLLGAWLIKFLNPIYLQLSVSLFLLANLPEIFKSKTDHETNEKPYPNFILAIIGFLSGLVSGITGAIGLLFNRFYLSYGLQKEEIVATRAANELFLHLFKLVVYITLGFYSEAAIYIGITIALASILSSFSIKYILPYISDLVFKKIGYMSMVLAGIFLLSSSVNKIIDQDHISVSTSWVIREQETSISWRESNFILEYSWEEGLEIERPILSQELPDQLILKYESMTRTYDRIFLEKVFRFREPISYEFYCYKGSSLTKFEFSE
ncbi:sulfite exporter TauE/SafE family protein [Leptospira selangorensis]|uniref:Probable membrane transporter protein n=1 Tax=Leptospira selangorensis TaxID=2484982 RepID=A0A5F2C4A5_9LEPT|nr:sulfite exporter TauE/SafE family protein [Leptospira selangorensis]TGM11145.1 sulfite exporter TauE/SafE family protein [Leptospira selangorensis]TGM23102.1 sulfite exporter TauE/SafE family protein [Leptospira selangorensis]